MVTEKYVVSCDWFSVSCDTPADFSPEDGSEYRFGTHVFSLRPAVERHPMFERAALVYEGNCAVAHIFWGDKRSIPSRKGRLYSAVAKVANSRLYYRDWAVHFDAMLHALSFREHHIQRVDVCVDFVYFFNRRLPLRFCGDYLSQPTKSRPSFIRRGSNKLNCRVERTMRHLDFQTLSWGSRESPCQVNLYNKSRELKDVKDKPWIRHRWYDAGIITPDDTKHSVWRMEMSLNPSAVALRDKESAVVREVSIYDVCNSSSLSLLFQSLIPRFFQFFYLAQSDIADSKKRVRDLRPVKLFDVSDDVPYVPSSIRYFRSTGRMQKLFRRRLIDNIMSDQLTGEERKAYQLILKRFDSVHDVKPDEKAYTIAFDTITEYLQSCFAKLTYPEKPKDDVQRAVNRYVRMMLGSHDDDVQRYMDAFRQFYEIEGTDAFGSLLSFADKVAGGFLPDDLICQEVDEDLERCAFEDYARQSIEAEIATF